MYCEGKRDEATGAFEILPIVLLVNLPMIPLVSNSTNGTQRILNTLLAASTIGTICKPMVKQWNP